MGYIDERPREAGDKPARPQFSSGPCAKRPGWTPDIFHDAVLGRSHRSKPGKARIKAVIDRTRAVLQVPDDYLIGVVPASDTGAVEMAMWSLLGPRPVQVLAWESFGKDWVTDAAEQLKLPGLETMVAEFGVLPDLARVRPDADLVFTWNGTTSGVRVPDADWIAADREGIVICDATSAAFAQPLDWPKLDVVTFSWQKVLGGEGGARRADPRARARSSGWRAHPPTRAAAQALPHDEEGAGWTGEIFEGSTITRPRCCASRLPRRLAGPPRSAASPSCSAAATPIAVSSAGSSAPRVDSPPPAQPLQHSVCLRWAPATAPDSPSARRLLEARRRLDIGAYRDAPPGLRIWCGATVDTADLEALTPWLDWAHATVSAEG
jgi:phosphoserine aminotransferase